MKNDNSTENESEKEQLLQRLDRAIASSKHARSVLNRELDELLTRYDRRPEFVDERRICGIAERVEPTGVSYRANGAYVVDSDGIITVGIGSLPELEDQYVDMFRNGIDELAKEYQTTKDASKKAELRNDIREKVNILNRINRE